MTYVQKRRWEVNYPTWINTVAARLGPDRLKEARARLCARCCHVGQGACLYPILPLTSDGEDCPYYVQSQPPTVG
jgi:hypothetical protein